MRNKLASIFLSALLAVSGIALFTACAPEEDKWTVTFQDGETVLFTQKVEQGGKAVRPEAPEKEGYIFMDWYGTPTFSHLYDFDRSVEEDITVFAGYAAHENDARNYYLLGNGTSPLLYASNWGNVITDAHKMTKSASTTENEYTMTVDLAEGDEFVFAVEGWGYKHGAGYIKNRELDGVTCFSAGDKLANVKVEKSGNYTFTMKTFPKYLSAGDLKPTDAEYVYKVVGNFDFITVVRNGDMIQGPVESVTDFYIKGSGITGWMDVYSPATKMSGVNGVYTLEVYLKANEEFMFGSTSTVDDVVSPSMDMIKFEQLNDESKALFTDANGNLKTKAAGMYTFTYTADSKVLSATLNADKAPAPADYYLNGTFSEGMTDWSGYCFNEAFQLKETAAGSGVYAIENVAMKADSEFALFAYKEGATETGDYGTDTWTMLGNYNFSYVYGVGKGFEAVGGGNDNIRVKEAGTYNVTFDSYSKMITIKSAEAGYDVYLNGTMNSWSHAFGAAYKFVKTENDSSKYELTYTFATGDEFGFAKFDEGVTEGYGDFLGNSAAGSAAATSKFVPASGSNFVAGEAGAFRIVYDTVSGKIDFYAVD